MIEVHEKYLPENLFAEVVAVLSEPAYTYGWHSSGGDASSFWNRTFYSVRDNSRLIGFTHPTIEKTWQSISDRFPRHRLDRAYANAMNGGQVAGIHRDSTVVGDITVLLYGMRRWRAEWAGETCFFDEDYDNIRAVSPRPNRCVIFDSNIPHVARNSTPTCPDLRVILAFKLRKNS